MIGSQGGGSGPEVQLHKLCSHLVGRGVGGSDALVTSHYDSALKLLTSPTSHARPGREEEAAQVERLVKGLARRGREREGAQVAALHQKLVGCSRGIIRNRSSLLCLLASLSESSRAARDFAALILPANPAPLRSGSSRSVPVTPGYHPPVPPKPRSRPPSALLDQIDGDDGGGRGAGGGGRGRTPAEVQYLQGTAPRQEALVRELVFAFQGIPGNIILDTGGRYSLDKSVVLPDHQRILVLKLCELGRLYTEVKSFTERQAGEASYGLVGHSFVTALREELTEYYRLLAALEAQLRGGGLTLLQVSVWTREPLARLKLLVSLLRTVGRARGGALAGKLYSHLDQQGAPTLHSCVSSLLSACCRPLYTMLLRWLLDGSLEDPHREFFIQGEASVQGEAMWHHKYSVREEMVPQFLTGQWTARILATGKAINFLSSVCRVATASGAGVLARLQAMDPSTLYQGELDNPLLTCVGEAYRAASRHVLDIMCTKFRLLDHLAALRKFLLLGQGDIMRYLLDLLEGELSQPATQLLPHNLAGILETAIRGTNTQFESPDILGRLDVKLLEIQPGDSGWDVFSLDYKVTGPIGVVFTPDAMTNYLMLFNTLWRAKRMEWVLSGVWQQLASIHKMTRQLKELSPVLHYANLVASEMIHFVHQLAYYITFEVMECGWAELQRRIQGAESLDSVIEAHNTFLHTLVARALLDEQSRELLTQLRAIYDRILEFQAVAGRIHQEAVVEWDARQARVAVSEARSRGGEFGVTEEEEGRDKDRRRMYSKSKLGSAKAQLRIVSQSYGDMVRTFLFQLTCSHDESLQCLSFRLDFNQHYKKRDARLSKPLTFSHRRLSMSGHGSPRTGSQMTSSAMSLGP